MRKGKIVAIFAGIGVAVLLLGLILLCSIHFKSGFEPTIVGSGQVSKIQKEGETYFVAKPDKWQEFLGWFSGNMKYSGSSEIKFTDKTPKNLEARFASSGYQSLDRTLLALYNNYEAGRAESGNYYSLSTNFDFRYADDNKDENYNGEFGGFLDFVNKENQIFYKSEKFNFTYQEKDGQGILFTDNKGEKNTYSDIGKLSEIWSELKDFDSAWTSETLFSSDFDQFLKTTFSAENSMGITEKVINDNDKTEIEINFNKLLSLLKNNANSLSEPNEFLLKLLDIFTGHYSETAIPNVTLKFQVNYTNEIIDDILVTVNVPRAYYLKLGSSEKKIPKSIITIKFYNIKYHFSDSKNQIPQDQLQEYPLPSKNLLNFSLLGNLAFKGSAPDDYKVELYSDINPFALAASRKGIDYQNTKWDKLGFLNFRVSLLDDATLDERHGGAKDYVNILLDTQKYGAKLLVYVGLYNPQSIYTVLYYVNNSFDLFELAENGSQSTFSSENSFAYSLLTELLESLLALSSGGNADEVVTNFVLDMFNLDFIKENLVTTDEGMVLTLAPVREKMRAYEEDVLKEKLGIFSLSLKLDELLFGKADDVSQIVYKTQSLTKSNFVKVGGEYLGSEGENIVQQYNLAHPTILGVTGINEFDKTFTLEEINSLVGQSVSATEVIYSDFSTSPYFSTNKRADTLNPQMLITKVEILSESEGEVRVKILLQVKDTSKFSNVPSLGETLYEKFGVPYGLMAYECALQTK